MENAFFGILGGGQLAQMLAEAGARLGLRVIALAKPGDPVTSAAPEIVPGAWTEPGPLREILSRARAVVFENEFVDRKALEEAARGLPVRFVPSLSAIETLQDKISQKKLLTRLCIPTAAWIEKPASAPIGEWIEEARSRFPSGFVLKWARLGYDGKGTWISTKSGDLSEFARRAEEKGVALFAEEKIEFRRELAIVAVRSGLGKLATYPLVVSEQENGICRLVTGPAVALGTDVRLEDDAREYAKAIGDALELRGAFAIELFETKEGGLRVNELAPRVHNTGHYTQDAADTSQFENHWRAALDMPLGSTATRPVFAMLNLLGTEATAKEPARPPRVREPIRLHWYGKTDARPGRKLGHLNIAGDDPAELPKLVALLRETERIWKHGK